MFRSSNEENITSGTASTYTGQASSAPMPRSCSDGSISSFGSQGEAQRIEVLEEQLLMLSHTAANALDRVSELESQLEDQRRSVNRRSSHYFDGETAHLLRLESALNAIHSARIELRSNKYYEYL